MTTEPRVLLLIGLLIAIAQSAGIIPDSCDCGYYITDTGYTYTHHISLDPSALVASDLSGSLARQGWSTSNYLQESSPKNIAYTPKNVRLNAASKTLDFYASGGPKSRKSVDSAELTTLLDDIRYGSFRFTVKTSNVGGACNGLFFYKDDQHEIDIEILTSHLSGPNTGSDDEPRNGLQLTVQPLSEDQITPNYKVVPFRNSRRSTGVFDPTTGYHQYRFDWTKTSVKYFVDGFYTHAYWNNLPREAGSVLINNWSNGDINWPAGPPLSDSVLSVKRVDIYYNVTDPAVLQKWEKVCKSSTRKQVCSINSK